MTQITYNPYLNINCAQSFQQPTNSPVVGINSLLYPETTQVTPSMPSMSLNIPPLNFGITSQLYNNLNFDLLPNSIFKENLNQKNNSTANNLTESNIQRVDNTGNKFQYTGSSQQIMRNAGTYFHKKGTYTPKRGDIAIWTKAGDPNHGHVGIVTAIEGDTIWITEGNSGNKVRTNKYSISKNLMSNSGSRPFNGFIDAHGWLGSDIALKAAKIAETEEAKGVVESCTKGGGSNDSIDIRRYKLGAKNNHQWCGYFTSYCFTDGQKLNLAA